MLSTQLEIDGNRILDIPTFYDEVNRVFMVNEDWKIGNSLDAFNDLLYGGFGTLRGNQQVTLVWKDMQASRDALGIDCTKKYYEEKLAPGSPFDKELFIRKLQELQAGRGQTYFDLILEVIADHANIKLVEVTDPATRENDPGPEIFYHGTRANFKTGDLISPGFASNYGKRKVSSFIYLTATVEAATWEAELALGEGTGRIYIVEPTGPIEDDPNLTDKKFPGNPTRSYRSRSPLRVTGELSDWTPHTEEQLRVMKDRLEQLKQAGIEAIDE